MLAQFIEFVVVASLLIKVSINNFLVKVENISKTINSRNWTFKESLQLKFQPPCCCQTSWWNMHVGRCTSSHVQWQSPPCLPLQPSTFWFKISTFQFALLPRATLAYSYNWMNYPKNSIASNPIINIFI